MRIISHNAFGNIVDEPATRIVIYDDFGNPIAVAIQLTENVCVASAINSPDFASVLRMAGIEMSTIVKHMDPTSETSSMTFVS